jgi:hypothetical protein
MNHTVVVADAREQFRNPNEWELLPLEDVTRRLVSDNAEYFFCEPNV